MRTAQQAARRLPSRGRVPCSASSLVHCRFQARQLGHRLLRVLPVSPSLCLSLCPRLRVLACRRSPPSSGTAHVPSSFPDPRSTAPRLQHRCLSAWSWCWSVCWSQCAALHLIIQTYGTLLDCENACERYNVSLEECARSRPFSSSSSVTRASSESIVGAPAASPPTVALCRSPAAA